MRSCNGSLGDTIKGEEFAAILERDTLNVGAHAADRLLWNERSLDTWISVSYVSMLHRQRGICGTEARGERITYHGVATGASNIGLHPAGVESNEDDALVLEPVNRSHQNIMSEVDPA